MNSLWKRDFDNNGIVMEGEYSKEEFGNIHQWLITEKIDGMSIRIMFRNGDYCYGPSLMFGGRTDKAQIPPLLVLNLDATFKTPLFESKFHDAKEVILFGEGYGTKIQKGGEMYRSGNGFILFDVIVDGIWLARDSVEDIAAHFSIPCVPVLGIMDEESAVAYVRKKPLSMIAKTIKTAEGIVARSEPLMLFRDGKPMMWKLKVRDFEELK